MFVVHKGGHKKSKDFEVVSVEGIFIFCSLFYPFMFFFLLCVGCEGLSCDCSTWENLTCVSHSQEGRQGHYLKPRQCGSSLSWFP